MLINNATHQRETLSEQPIRLPLNSYRVYQLHRKQTENGFNCTIIINMEQKVKYLTSFETSFWLFGSCFIFQLCVVKDAEMVADV